VWIFSGTLDTVVVPDIVEITKNFFMDFKSNVFMNNFEGAEHAFPTNLTRN